MRCDEIIRLLEKKAPIEYAMDWDHVGLLVGRRDKEVHKLMLVVDVTEEIVDAAVAQKKRKMAKELERLDIFRQRRL